MNWFILKIIWWTALFAPNNVTLRLLPLILRHLLLHCLARFAGGYSIYKLTLTACWKVNRSSSADFFFFFFKGKSCLARDSNLVDGHTKSDRTANLDVFLDEGAENCGYPSAHHRRRCLSTRVRQVQPCCHILQLSFRSVLNHRHSDSWYLCNLCILSIKWHLTYLLLFSHPLYITNHQITEYLIGWCSALKYLVWLLWIIAFSPAKKF